jgi:hypothetical protein
LLPTFGSFVKGKMGFVLYSLQSAFFAHAHYESGYEEGQIKWFAVSTTLKKSTLGYYDKNLDPWTKEYLGENPKAPQTLNATLLFSKYNSKFTYATATDPKQITLPTVQFLRDSTAESTLLKIKISPNRKVNRYDVLLTKNGHYQLKANGAIPLEQKELLNAPWSKNSKLLCCR